MHRGRAWGGRRQGGHAFESGGRRRRIGHQWQPGRVDGRADDLQGGVLRWRERGSVLGGWRRCRRIGGGDGRVGAAVGVGGRGGIGLCGLRGGCLGGGRGWRRLRGRRGRQFFDREIGRHQFLLVALGRQLGLQRVAERRVGYHRFGGHQAHMRIGLPGARRGRPLGGDFAALEIVEQVHRLAQRVGAAQKGRTRKQGTAEIFRPVLRCLNARVPTSTLERTTRHKAAASDRRAGVTAPALAGKDRSGNGHQTPTGNRDRRPLRTPNPTSRCPTSSSPIRM